MKKLVLAAWLAAATIAPAAAQEYFDIDADLAQYPEMQPIPDSPVYYAPEVDSNYFYYDGLYWDYCCDDHWFASQWYNGPWTYVDPVYVPTYVLWVPVRYYHKHPPFFRGSHPDRPPHWGQHWGRGWQDRHNAAYRNLGANPPVRAPLPTYQRNYPRGSYPRAPQQQAMLHARNYAFQPRETITRQHYDNRTANPAERSRSPAGTRSP